MTPDPPKAKIWHDGKWITCVMIEAAPETIKQLVEPTKGDPREVGKLKTAIRNAMKKRK